MSPTKLIVSTMIVSAALLSGGCSNSTRTKVDRLSSGSATMEHKIEQLDSDISILSSEVESAKKNAHRANDRLDNQAHSYRK